MEITHSIEEVAPVLTNTNPAEYLLHLTARGNYQEIHWLARQLEGLSETDGTLINVYEDYIRLLASEIEELAPIAQLHGWSSTKIKQGLELRNKINDLKNL